MSRPKHRKTQTLFRCVTCDQESSGPQLGIRRGNAPLPEDHRGSCACQMRADAIGPLRAVNLHSERPTAGKFPTKLALQKSWPSRAGGMSRQARLDVGTLDRRILCQAPADSRRAPLAGQCLVLAGGLRRRFSLIGCARQGKRPDSRRHSMPRVPWARHGWLHFAQGCVYQS
jgi:hypothetical protein